jgi:F420H(2)-dependent biliverdin reductase
MSLASLDPRIEQRLQTEPNLWLATVRPNGTPHLVPIWFVWLNGKIYLCTGADSVKARNLRGQPQVSIALEDGSQPVVMEGSAHFIGRVDQSVVEAFRLKYDWDITVDETYTQVIEIELERIRA